MKNHSMPTPIFFVLCLFFLLYNLKIATSTPRYIPVDNITLNCGSSVNLKDMDERHWVGDMLSSKFALLPNHRSNISEAQGFSSVDAVPYQTARLSYSEFTYVFPVTPGPKFVRLYFYSASYSGFDMSKDLFTVKAGLFTLLGNFSASIFTDSLDQKNFFKEFCVNVEMNQELNLTVIPFPSTSFNYYAFINGIEIVSMPIDLYYSQKGFIKDEWVPQYVAQAPQFYINYSMALEMVYRLNVGGGSIQPKEDTGMLREWLDSTDYLLSEGVCPRVPSLKPKFTTIPNYTAPDAIYQSAIIMGPNRTRNSLSNLTWGLPVDTGFNYLVRLHFCELESEIHVTGIREFSIYIDSMLAEETADVLLWTDDNDTPHYKDYVVMIEKKDEDSHVLSIDLHPVSDSIILDAILNGVEVFKLSNSDGNLAAPVARLNMVLPQPDQKTEPAAIKSKKKKKTIFIAIGSGVGFLIVLILVCFMAVWKLRRTKHFSSYKGKIRRTKASSLPEELCHHFTLDEMKTATNNFHEELIIGVGGFGNVYKGAIDKGNVYFLILQGYCKVNKM